MSDETAQDRTDTERNDAHPPLPQDALILLPVRQVVLFPGMMLPVAIGRQSSIAARRRPFAAGGRSVSSCKPTRRSTIRSRTNCTASERWRRSSVT
jgi:ATP-dependent Lon protease